MFQLEEQKVDERWLKQQNSKWRRLHHLDTQSCSAVLCFINYDF